MDLGLEGRVALVCASSGGLGKAAAVGFAQEGASVVLCAREPDRLKGAAADVRAAARDEARVSYRVADLSRREDITGLVDHALAEFGRLDILVTNAGGPPVAAFQDLGEDAWERGIDLTLRSTIRCIRAVLPHMVKQGWGRIINITSVSARQPINDLVISSTLRPGILGLAKVLANQYGRHGILINNVAPGYMLTDRQKEISAARAAGRGISSEEYVRELAREIPVQRYGDPAELASLIVFLGSERAGYITGATIGVDGGLTKGLF
jgi:3-oxoacyl-[acyl-carrier protein] reductase